MLKMLRKKINLMRKYHRVGKEFLNNAHYLEGKASSDREGCKTPLRTDIINFVVSLFDRETVYLEIGVRIPAHNFDKIKADHKYSVDPGVENKENPVDYKVTSDVFFQKLDSGEILDTAIRFDVIFIDGLHLAGQVNRDIENALRYIKDDGYIILHDCNPPTEWHTRCNSTYYNSPATGYWNGTTWKAFLKWRTNPLVYSCCIDTDWGVGVLSKSCDIGTSIEKTNEFYEFAELASHRKEYMNLITFDTFKERLARNVAIKE